MSELKIMEATCKFSGIVSEISLTEQDGTVRGENDKKIPCKVIMGNVVIKNENGTFPLRVYSCSKTKKNETNSMYKGYQTIMKDYVSELDVAKNPELGHADFVNCNTDVSLNDYVSRNGNLVSAVDIKLNNMRRTKDKEENSYVNIEGRIMKIVPEKDKEENETGRLEVTILNVAYGGVGHPYVGYVPAELAEDFMDMYQVGDTGLLSFELKSTTQKKKVERKPGGFGKVADTSNDYERLELVVCGGDPPYDDDDVYTDGTPKKLSKEDANQLMNERKMYLEDLKKNKDKKNKGKSEGKRGLAGVKKENNPDDEDDDNVDYAALFDE